MTSHFLSAMTAPLPPSPAFDSALQQAIAHHQAGRLQEAEQLYRTILQAQPDQPDANHNLGILLLQTGQHTAGLPCLKAALDASPSRELFWQSYAEGLLATGQAKKARNIIQAALKRGFDTPALQALRQKAKTAEPGNHSKEIAPQPGKTKKTKAPPPDKISSLVALFNAGRHAELESQARLLLEQYPDSGFGWKALGASLKSQGKDSLPALQKATELEPDNAEAHSNLGIALQDLGQFDDAVASLRRALEIRPNSAEAYNNLGSALIDLDQLDSAAANCRRALEIKPDYAEAYSNLGVALKGLGQLDDAVASLRRAMEIRPDYAEAHNNLGGALIGTGQLDDAVASLRRALKIRPDYAEAHNNLGSALKDLGQLDSAVASYRRAVEIKPDYAEAYNNLGVALKGLGQLDSAVASYRRAVEIRPDYAEAYNNLGVALTGLGQLDDAVASLRQALEIRPDYAEAHNNLGGALIGLGQLDDAVASLRRALEIRPDYADAYSNLGSALKDLGQLDDAVASLRRAIEIKPDYADAHNNLGVTLKDLGQLDDAVASLRRTLEIKPDYAEAYSNLGITLQALGQPDSAVASYQRALEIKPDYAEAHHNLGFTFLGLGQLEAGWKKYEWRWKVKPSTRHFPQLWWDGSDLAGKTLLVWGEQGVGDEILFASVLPDAIRAAGHCVVECDYRLVTLFARSFPQAEIIPRSNPPHPRLSLPDIQLQCPIGNLPRWFRPSLESFPQHHDYLKADPERVAFWKQRLDALGSAPKVGICWRSRLRKASRDIHYTELSQWGPILAVPGAVFVNLQYDECRAELEAASEQFGVEIHAWDDIDLMNDLDEAAALTCALDLVISPNTSVFAMAGALEKPVWLINQENDWGTLGTNTVPWLPDTRLFVKGVAQNWDAVIENVAEALKQQISV